MTCPCHDQPLRKTWTNRNGDIHHLFVCGCVTMRNADNTYAEVTYNSDETIKIMEKLIGETK